MKGNKAISFMGLTAALLLSCIGCGQAEEKAAMQQGGGEYVYVADYYPVELNGYAAGNAILGSDDIIYMNAYKEDSPDKVFCLNAKDGSIEEIPLELEEDWKIGGIGSDQDHNLLLGVVKYAQTPAEDGETEESEGGEAAAVLEKAEIKKVSAEGKIIESVDTTNAFKKIPDFYIQSMLTDKSGNYYICDGQNIYIVKPDGELFCEIPVNNYVSNMFSIKGEKVVVGYFDGMGWQMKEVDAAQKGLNPISSSIAFDYGTYLEGTDTDLIYTQNTVLYTCNLKDEKPTEILKWVDCDVDSNNLRTFKILADGRIAAFTTDWNSPEGESEFVILTKKNRSEVPEKKVLTYGTLYLPYFTNKDIVAFNKQSDEYRIEVKQYGDDNTDYDTKASLFNADISSGKGPDMFDLSYGPLSLDEYISMGIIEDLYPYLEADNVKREDYVENAFSAYEKDGKLYAIMPSFTIQTIIGKTSEVGTNSSWTVGEMMALADLKGKDAEILPYSTKTSMLYRMFTINEGEFVNWETGECNFTNDAFGEILEFANHFPKEVNYDPNSPSEIERIRNGQLILTEASITSAQQYQMYEYMFGEPVNFIGYPTIAETGSILAPYGTTVAMNAQSQNKEGVWEFICYNLSKGRQEKSLFGDSRFPVLKTELENRFEKDMTQEYYEDADGNKKEKAKSTWGTNDFSVEVYAATEAQINSLKAIIESASTNVAMDSKIIEIINEEAQAYFEGQKSIEDVAAVIQNRVQTYVNEVR